MHRWKFPVLFWVLLVVAAAGGGSGDTAQAATTRGWTGAVNSNWTTAGNWSPAGVPVNGDSVVVAAEGAHITGVPLGLTIEALYLGANVEISGEPLKISSAITVTRANIVPTLDLVVVLNGNVLVSVPPEATLRLRRRVSPLGTVAVTMAGRTLTKANGGDVELSGDVVGAGTLAATGGQISILYPLTFGGTVSLGPGTDGYLTKRGTNPILCGSAPGARFVLTSAHLGTGCNNGVNSVGSLSGQGSLSLNDRFSIVVTGDTFDGVLTGTSSAVFTCCAQGVQTLQGESKFFTGTISVTGGSLLLEGATFPAAAQFTAQGAGAFPAGLGGFGTFGQTIMTTAVLDLASVNGKFGLARFPQLLLAQDVEVDYEIGGPVPGTGFTQLVTTDQVDIAGARLSLDFGSYVPAPGQSFTLVKGFTTGTFRNIADDRTLAEGALFTASGMQFKISYNGAANDVVITRQGDSPPVKFKRFVPMVSSDR
ncbi:MAG: hypothetical protein ABIQ47_10030 [Tepidiformaceae bacterium]